MGGLVQIALALSVFAIMTGLGVGELAQYAQSKLPYTIVQRVVSAANLVNNAASSYIVQNCMSAGVNGCGLSIQSLHDNGYLPTATGSTLQTPDGSNISVTTPSSTQYQVVVTPGAVIQSKPSYMNALAAALPGGYVSGGSIYVTEASPSIENMIASNKPVWGSLNQSGTTQSTGGGGLSTGGGTINTNGAPIYSGSVNTGSISSGSINTNRQPITSGTASLGNNGAIVTPNGIYSNAPTPTDPYVYSYPEMASNYFIYYSSVPFPICAPGSTCNSNPGYYPATLSSSTSCNKYRECVTSFLNGYVYCGQRSVVGNYYDFSNPYCYRPSAY